MPETVVHFQIRMPPDIHERLASWAKSDKVVEVLKNAIDQREAQPVGVGNGSSHQHR